MDIKAKIDELVAKVKNDKDIATKFQKDPTGTVKELLGVDIPVEQLMQIAEGVKGKIKLDDISGMVGGLFGKK